MLRDSSRCFEFLLRKMFPISPQKGLCGVCHCRAGNVFIMVYFAILVVDLLIITYCPPLSLLLVR